MEAEQYITVQEAAKELGITESAIRNATLKGRLPFARLFGRKLIRRNDLNDYVRRTRPSGQRSNGRPRRTAGDQSPTPAEMLQIWDRDGVLGLFEDRPDSPELARGLRHNASTRDWD